MSEFLAEAQVLIRPDTSKFRRELEGQLAAIRVAPITVPVVAAAGGLATAAAATSALQTAQRSAEATTLGLASAAQVENTAFGRQAAILQAASTATLQVAGAQEILDRQSRKTTASLLGAGSATARLDAALLGLRTAVGSAAVIGLGAAALAAIAVGKAIRTSIEAFVSFERELNTFQATVGATAEEMLRVREAAERLGADVRLPAVSAADAAVAMSALARAGLDVENAIAGAEGVLQLATAAQIENAVASELVANALNAFNLAGEDATTVADNLANAANAAQGSIEDFGVAMQQVAAVSNLVGVSLQDTTALLTLLAQNGLRGSDAGTSLRVAFLRLVAPTEDAADLIEKLGINIRDAQGNIRPDVFAQFAEATEGLGPELRDAAAAAIFGQDAIRAVALAGQEGAAGLRLMRFEIDQQGTAAQLAEARTKGLGGQFEALKSGAETTGIEIGRLSAPILSTYISIAQDAVTATGFLIRRFNDLAASAGNVQTPIGNLGDRIKDYVSITNPVIGGLRLIRLGIDQLTEDADADRVRELQQELQNLQKARIAAERGGAPGIADSITGQIKVLREEIRKVRIEAGEIIPPQNAGERRVQQLQETVRRLNRALESAAARGIDTSEIEADIRRIQALISEISAPTAAAVTQGAETSLRQLKSSLQAAIEVFEIDPGGELASKSIAQIRALISRVSAEAPKAGAAGRDVGRAILKALQEAIIAAAQAGEPKAAKALQALAKALAAAFQGSLDQEFGKIKIPLLGDEIEQALQPSELAVAQAEATGTRGAQIQALEAQRQAILDLIASGRAHGQELTDLFNQLAAINADIQSKRDAIQAEIEAEAERARRAQEARDEAFIRMLGIREQRLRLRELRAEGTAGLKDDIAVQKDIRNFFEEAIREARRTIQDVQKRVETVLQLREAMERAIQKLREKRRTERRQARDRQLELLDLKIEIAEVREQRKLQIKLLQERIKLLRERIRQTRAESVERARLQLELARTRKDLEDVVGEQKKTSDISAQAFFEFLQRQQGFAANLLGNLIPLGATQGLVGQPSPQREIEQTAAVSAARERGVTIGQGDQTNHLLREILDEIRKGNLRQAHPEARTQRRMASASMDTVAL